MIYMTRRNNKAPDAIFLAKSDLQRLLSCIKLNDSHQTFISSISSLLLNITCIIHVQIQKYLLLIWSLLNCEINCGYVGPARVRLRVTGRQSAVWSSMHLKAQWVSTFHFQSPQKSVQTRGAFSGVRHRQSSEQKDNWANQADVFLHIHSLGN